MSVTESQKKRNETLIILKTEDGFSFLLKMDFKGQVKIVLRYNETSLLTHGTNAKFIFISDEMLVLNTLSLTIGYTSGYFLGHIAGGAGWEWE